MNFSLNNGNRTQRTIFTSVSTVTTTSVGQLEQFGIDDLVGFLEYLHQIVSFAGVARREEGVGCAGLLSAPGSANPVHVIFRARRVVKIDNELDIFNVWNEQMYHIMESVL